MKTELDMIRNWMESCGRRPRLTPTNFIPVEERIAQCERIATELWRVADGIGISIGPRPTFISSHKSEFFSPILMADINELLREVLALYFVLGMSSSAESSFRESFKPTPNFTKVFIDSYCDEIEIDIG